MSLATREGLRGLERGAEMMITDQRKGLVCTIHVRRPHKVKYSAVTQGVTVECKNGDKMGQPEGGQSVEQLGCLQSCDLMVINLPTLCCLVRPPKNIPLLTS